MHMLHCGHRCVCGLRSCNPPPLPWSRRPPAPPEGRRWWACAASDRRVACGSGPLRTRSCGLQSVSACPPRPEAQQPPPPPPPPRPTARVIRTYEEQGIYGVSFFVRGVWKMVWVDSYFPCYRPNTSTHRQRWRLIFASSSDQKVRVDGH